MTVNVSVSVKAFVHVSSICVACVLFVRDWKGSASRLTLSNQGQTSARADFLCVLHAAVGVLSRAAAARAAVVLAAAAARVVAAAEAKEVQARQAARPPRSSFNNTTPPFLARDGARYVQLWRCPSTMWHGSTRLWHRQLRAPPLVTLTGQDLSTAVAAPCFRGVKHPRTPRPHLSRCRKLACCLQA